MNCNWVDRELAERFHDLRQTDERLTPPFTRVWQAASVRVQVARRPQRISRRVAAATALLVAAGVGGAIFRQPVRPSATTTLTAWRSPTDFLLRSPGETLLKTVPQVGESVVGIQTIISNTQAGDQK